MGGNAQQQGFNGMATGGNYGGMVGNPSFNNPANNNYSGAGQSATLKSEDNNGLEGAQAKMMELFMNSSDTESGLALDDIAQKLGLSMSDVKKHVDYLSGEGHIYSTIDELHYKSTH